MSSCPDPQQLSRVVAGSGDTAARQTVLDHAARCEECHAALLVLRASTTGSTGPAAVSASAPTAGPEVGDTLIRYKLETELGRGAMGVVYAARDLELDRDVAVKVLRASASAPRLKREAQALARLAHPNVVRVYDVGEHDGRAFVAMELVRGSNLREWLRTPRSVDDTLAVLRRAGEGLAAAHRAGLVHRDMKPDNVLIADDGGVLVGDFGLARAAEPSSHSDGSPPVPAIPLSDEHLTATGVVVGTPAYMAPEQSAGDASTASDQFGFCVTAWEALYGQRPFLATTMRELRDQVSAGIITTPPARGDVPPHVERALRRGLAPAPSARFPSMDALLAALGPRARRRWMAPAALTALAAGGVAALVVLGGARSSDRAAACQVAAAAIEEDWPAATAAQVTARAEPATTEALAYYVARWRERRDAACRAGSEPQIACLERARVAFRQTVGGVVAASTTLQPDAIVRVLPALERCDHATPQAPPPPPEVAAAVAALDDRIAALEIAAVTRVPTATRADVSRLYAEARALGYRPQMRRVQLLDGMVAALVREDAAAVTIFREVMVAAEGDADDFTRARAGAHLALLQARQRSPETAATITAARAALARAGQDSTIEILLLTAEAAAAFGREDFLASAEARERIIALTLAHVGPDAPLLGEAYASAAGAFALGGDRARSAARYADMTAYVARDLARRGTAPDDAAALAGDPTVPMTAGDFAEARRVGERKLAAQRHAPSPNLLLVADTLLTLGRASEFDGDCNAAIAHYADAVATFRRPVAELAVNNQAPDPEAIAMGMVEALMGQGACLLRVGAVERAVTVLREAVAEATKGGDLTARDLPATRRWLGQALSAAGQHREAIDLLTPIVDGIPATIPKPYTQGLAQFALARSLWSAGGLRDRERAQALAVDAEHAFARALADSADPGQPFLRPIGPLAREQGARVTAWRAAHPPGVPSAPARSPASR